MKLHTVAGCLAGGDCLLFEGTGAAAWLVRMRTRSRFAHVGLVTTHFGRPGEPWFIEATWPRVRLLPLGRRLEEARKAHDVAHWFRLDQAAVDGQAAAWFAAHQIGKRYASLPQFLVSFGLLTRLRRWWQGLKPADLDPERWFCSELAMAALQAGGFRLDTGEDWIAAATEPGRIATLSCLRREGILEA